MAWICSAISCHSSAITSFALLCHSLIALWQRLYGSFSIQINKQKLAQWPPLGLISELSFPTAHPGVAPALLRVLSCVDLSIKVIYECGDTKNALV